MKGQVLDYSIQSNQGVITAEDGNRYTFAGAQWKESIPPVRGMQVDFEVDGDKNAMGVYKALRAQSTSINLPTFGEGSNRAKSKVIAGLLALFLGGFGAHKFYLGFAIPGVVYLVGSFICSILAGVTEQAIFFLPAFIIGVMSLIDAILYFTKSDEDFQRIYGDEKKQWF